MKKTKIICSIGPASSDYKVFKQMVESGMNVARINFSHATKEEVEKVLNLVKKVNEDLDHHVAVLYDTKGPDFRTGKTKTGSIELIPGETIKIVKEDILGTEEKFTVNYKETLDYIEVGNTILLEDGLMKLEVIDKNDEELICKIIDGGILKDKKGVSVPGVNLNLNFISKQDEEDIIYACQNDGDFLALSFVSCAEDVLAVREILKSQGREDMQLISKIESETAIKNIDSIIKVSDGIMVARGDLGVEMPMDKLPILQKQIIEKCRTIGRTSIVATEMLASMYTSARPTRAEISDVANAVLDGTDAIMLSGETTVGKHPIKAVQYMSQAAKTAEEYYDYKNQKSYARCDRIPSAIAQNVIDTDKLLNIKGIVVATATGYTAKLIGTLKPKSLVLAACNNEKVAKSLALNYGVYPAIVKPYDDIESLVENCKLKAIDKLKLKEDDLIIITGGFPDMNKLKTTNFLKIETIKKDDIRK